MCKDRKQVGYVAAAADEGSLLNAPSSVAVDNGATPSGHLSPADGDIALPSTHPSAAATPAKKAISSTSPDSRQPFRAPNEDDDGYDPYSDIHDARIPEPLFEEDPWS